MILANNVDDNGLPIILIGLSRGNCEKLLEGKPIFKGPDDTMMQLSVIVVGGETEDDIVKSLKDVGFQFDFIFDERTAS
jgi:hypothetical protein